MHYYMHSDITDRLYVNTTLSTDIKVSFDFTFSDLPCGCLSINAVDDMGDPQELPEHEIFKHRLNAAGAKVGRAERHSVGGGLQTEEDLKDLADAHFTHLHAMRNDKDEFGRQCGNCYGRIIPMDTSIAWPFIFITSLLCRRWQPGSVLQHVRRGGEGLRGPGVALPQARDSAVPC
jgi:Endoplasmic Reticulum-Golgi Intermediate Compartment (ERGIC)